MTNPFDCAPTRRRRFQRGGRVPKGYFIGGLFSSSPGSSSSSMTGESQTHSQADNTVLNGNYNELLDYILGGGLDLLKSSPDTVAGLNQNQIDAANTVRYNKGLYQPDFWDAANSLTQARGYDPGAAGSYVTEAARMPTGSTAAAPWFDRAGGFYGTATDLLGRSTKYGDQAAEGFPQHVNEYMSPYTQRVVDEIARLGGRNLEENLLPKVNDVFTGAQFGRKGHADFTARTVRDSGANILGEQARALESGYKTAADIFGQDQARRLGLVGATAGAAGTAGGLANAATNTAGVAGNLANQDATTRAMFGQTASNIAGAGVNAGINLAGASEGLGQARSAMNLSDADALMRIGQMYQGQEQAELGSPFSLLQFGQGLGQGWQLPTRQVTDSNSTFSQRGTSQVQQPSGSPFGSILGGALGLASLAVPGAGGVSALGNIMGGIRGLFEDGGYVGDYAVGGMVPTIAQMRKRLNPAQGMMPTGMPGMPPMPSLVPQQPGGQPNGQPGGAAFADGGLVDPTPNVGLDQGTGAVSDLERYLMSVLQPGAGAVSDMERHMMPAPPMPSPFDMGGGEAGASVGGPSADAAGAAAAAAGVGAGTGDTYAQGGDVGMARLRDIIRGVHEHERNMHRGKRATNLNFAQGGYTPFERAC